MSVVGQHVQVSLNPTDGSMRVTHMDPLTVCPLDSSHRLPSSKLQSHLERCLIGDLVQMKCPWNPLHIIDESSYQYHINICEDRPLPAVEEESANL